MATGNHLRHLKKNTRNQHLLCAMQKEKDDICRFYCCSHFFLTGNDLGVMVFFPENHDKTDEVSDEIAGSLKFGFSAIISVGKIQQ